MFTKLNENGNGTIRGILRDSAFKVAATIGIAAGVGTAGITAVNLFEKNVHNFGVIDTLRGTPETGGTYFVPRGPEQP